MVEPFVTYQVLPENMKNEVVEKYFAMLQSHKFNLVAKRIFDVVFSVLILIFISPIFLVLSLAIKIDSKGPVFYRQIRVGRYNQNFKIFKFRTMVVNADKIGLQLTSDNDPRITRIGKLIRKCRLDEFSQILNVISGTMSLVGPRPEVRKYVDVYTSEYMATLLVRPGITATSSIAFKNEDELLNAGGNPEQIYIDKILPQKMKLNLEYIKHISIFCDIKIMFQTVAAVVKK